MTSANVTQAAGLFPDVKAAGVISSITGASGNGFSQVMDRTKQGLGDGSGEMWEENRNAVKTPVKVEKNTVRSADSRENQVSEPDKKSEMEKTGLTESQGTNADTEKVDEKVQEAMEEAVSEITEAVKEQLGITDEELEAILETLGLGQMDLLNGANMQAIVIAASGEADGLSILTDENLYQSLQQLTEMVEATVTELKNQFQVDDAGFGDLLKQMEVSGEPEEISVDFKAGQSKEQTPVIEVSSDETKTVSEQAADTTEEALQENKSVTATDENGGLNPAKEQTEGLSETEHMQEHREGKNNKDSSENKNHAGAGNHENPNSFLQGTIRTNADAWNTQALQGRMEMPFQQADVQNIMDQITEYMKIETNMELTELELQLQPEALGTVKIHMTAKEGVITAQFTTENEAVKAVIETQAVQLKENLNNQGIKVEAVEVTVANQGFNRSFMENGDSAGEYEEPKKKGIRKIQLTDDMDIEDMELSEEDRIAAEMMEMNGNTVDYTA